MNASQAKQLNLPELMEQLGYEPTEIKKGGKEYWYNSPFRKETDASFHTSYLGGKWIWNDFGDTGGTVIDFILRHENLTNVRDALKFLNQLTGENPSRKGRGEAKKQISSLFSFHPQDPPLPETTSELELIEASPIQNPLIFSYLSQQRAIPRSLAEKHLVEVRYCHKPTGRKYFAMGVKNESGGYEIRVASDKYDFNKACLGKKDISLKPGFKDAGGTVNIFEGFTDYLSLLALYGAEKLQYDGIILNTTKNFDRAVDFIRKQGYQTINTFLDNDEPGKACTQQFIAEFGTEQVKPQNHLYVDFNDVNEMLVDNQPKIAKQR